MRHPSPRPRASRPLRTVAAAAAALLVTSLVPAVSAAAAADPREADTACPGSATSDFADVAGSAHESAVRCLADLGLTEGLRGGEDFGPRQDVTRGQMASFVARFIESVGGPLPDAPPRFDDVPTSGYVHRDAIDGLAVIGVVEGRGDGSRFDPQGAVSRGQLASFVRRALSYLATGDARDGSLPPADDTDHYADDDGSTHEANIDALTGAGIVQGFTDGTFRPNDPVLRDQTATFVVRALDLALVELAPEPPPVDPDPDPDPDPEPEPVDPGPEPVDATCEALDDDACLLPFPSDRFTRSASTPTGLRVDLPAEGMPVSEGLPIPVTEDVTLPAVGETPIDPTEWNRNDGFSPGTPILTHVADLDLQATFGLEDGVQVLDRPALSLADDAPIVLLDASTGERVPYLAELDSHPGAVEADTRLLIVRPLEHLTPGHRFVVATRDLVDEDGAAMAAGDEFAWYRDRPDGTPGADEGSRVPAMERVFDDLAAAGVARDDLHLAWDFTVASSEGLTGRAVSVRDRAFAAIGDTDLGDRELDGTAPEFAITGLITEGLPADTARRIDGRVRVPNFLHPQTGDPAPSPGTPGTWALESLLGETRARFAYSGTAPAPGATPLRANTDVSVPFVCNVPATASAGDPSAPLLYGHGLLGTKREANGGSTVRLRERNFTVCAVDWAGMSEFDQLVVAGILQEASGMPIMADRLQQAHLNFSFLGRALLHPEGLSTHPAFQDGEGASLLDLDAPLSYDGNSQGGIMGGATIALSPDITRGTLGVPGMNYSTLLNRSLAFEQRELGTIYNANYTDPIERQLGFGLLQMLWDRGENNGYAHVTTADPLPNTPSKSVLLQVAYGDHLVTPLSAEVQARAYGARLLQTSLAPGRHWSDDPDFRLDVFDVGAGGDLEPHEGSAIVYFDSGNTTPPSVNLPPVYDGEEDPHEDPRRDQSGADQRDTFLRTGIVEDVRGGEPYWTVECRGPFNPVACP